MGGLEAISMPEWLIQLFLAGAIYGGIRSDLKSMQAGIVEAKAIGVRAHDRLDNHLQSK